MGVTKKILQAGDGQNFPKPGDKVSMHYRGCLYDQNQPENMGKE